MRPLSGVYTDRIKQMKARFSRYSLPHALLAVLCLLCLPLQAQEALRDVDATGTESVEPELEQTIEKAGEPVLTEEEKNAALSKREQAILLIGELEDTAGVYSQALSQAYTDLGDAYQTLGRHEEAVEAYGNALQAVRINNGLNDTNQLPILDKYVDSYRALENWKAVDTNLHLYHHIARRSFAPGDDRRIEALLKLGRWKLQAAGDKLLYEHVGEEALQLYQKEIEFLESVEEYPDKGLHMARLYLDYASTALYQATWLMNKPIEDFQQSGQSRSVTRMECTYIRTPDGKLIPVCSTVEVPNLDYYLIPSHAKTMEIRRYLNEMKSSIVKAYDAVEGETGRPDLRNALLSDVHRLTGAYNSFVSGDN